MEEIDALLQDLSDLGTMEIDISGGEPLMRDDILQIIELVVSYGFEVTVITNGTLINKEFSRKDAVDIIRNCNEKIEIPNKKTFTGKEIFSIFLPKDFSIEYKAKCCKGCKKCLKEKCPYDAYVKIKNGKLLTGTIDKNGIAVFSGKILDEIDKQYGHDFTKEFLFKITKLSFNILTRYGFSVAISDTDLDQKVIEKTHNPSPDALN